MNISEICIRRPVLTTLMTASLIVFGAFAYRLLPVAALPAVDFPTIQITATFPGASPETMAASVASPIERQLSTISGISSMTSSSSFGSTQITIQFDLGRNIDGAALDVQTALAVAQRRLPVEMTTPPFFRKVNPGDFPVLYVSMRSDTMPLSSVDEYAETVLAPTDLAVARRRPGAGLRRAEIRRARSGQTRSPPPRATSHSTISVPSSPRPIPVRRSARCSKGRNNP